MPTHTLTIDGWHPTLLNKLLRGDRRAAAKKKHVDCEVVCGEAARQGVARATGRRRVAIVMRYPAGKVHCDFDAPLKVLLDALSKAKLLRDDNPTWLESVSVRYETGPKATIIHLEDCE